MPLKIIETKPNDIDVEPLIEALSIELEQRFGSSGKNSFQEWDDTDTRFVFVKAMQGNEVIGCGAIRPISNEVAEIKRMYAKYNRQGIGKAVLDYLENKALSLGYKEVWLETRRLNHEACAFYLKHHYQEIPNYGKYIGNEKAICFGNDLTSKTQ